MKDSQLITVINLSDFKMETYVNALIYMLFMG